MKNLEGYERAILRSLLMRADPDDLCIFLNTIFTKEKKFLVVEERNEEELKQETFQNGTNST